MSSSSDYSVAFRFGTHCSILLFRKFHFGNLIVTLCRKLPSQELTSRLTEKETCEWGATVGGPRWGGHSRSNPRKEGGMQKPILVVLLQLVLLAAPFSWGQSAAGVNSQATSPNGTTAQTKGPQSSRMLNAQRKAAAERNKARKAAHAQAQLNAHKGGTQ